MVLNEVSATTHSAAKYWLKVSSEPKWTEAYSVPTKLRLIDVSLCFSFLPKLIDTKFVCLPYKL